ncbi:carbohydrate ABC transporter permease [Atribacter laminatus]|uniref:Trehalose transport system permease protein SugA n=1 Tax=Atribacter laminatus TaxID=2847778 RepID=A0A7T1ALJ5_ATRLM|nr:sugar ABC transporter permease [Atribacter laminatus]QPM68163.1 Trehalose transport system permease protein SugA [Atribacter laminatus]
MRKEAARGWAFLLPTMLFLVILTIYPFIFTVSASLTNWYLPETKRTFIGIQNFINLFKDPWFWSSLRITLIFLFGCLFFEHFFGFLLALLLSLLGKAKSYLPLFFIVPMMLPPIVSALIWKLMYRPLGLMNWFLSLLGISPINWVTDSNQVLPSIMITDIWQWTPFVMLILFSGINSIPEELFDAVDIDGGGLFAKIKHLILPLIKPLFIISFLLRFIFIFTTFDIIAGLSRGGPGHASMTLYYYSYLKSFEWLRMGEGASLNIFVFAITMGVGMILLNKIMKGSVVLYD